MTGHYTDFSLCRLCGGPLHPCISCSEAHYRRVHGKPVSYVSQLPPPSYVDDYESEMEDDYYAYGYNRDEEVYYDESDDSRLTQSLSYQEEYEYDDYYNYYSQPSCQDYQVEYCNYQHDYSQPAYEDHQAHKSESFDEMMRKRHMAHIEQELTKPQLSMEDRLELLEWKYDLLPKEVKEVRPGMSIWEKRQAKQQWLSVQIEQTVVEELKDEHDMSDEEGKVVTPPEFEDEYLEIIIEEPPMEDKIVEDNTTPMSPVSDEESLVDQMMCADYVVEQADGMDMCTEPLPISMIQINKCGEEGSRNKIRRVKLPGDIKVYVMRRTSKASRSRFNMPNILTNLWRWHVNFRAFVGNAVGKCSLKPP